MAMVFFKVPFRVGMMGETGYVEKVTFLVETNVPEGDVVYKVENFVYGSGAKYEFFGGIGELELPTSVGANPVAFEYKVTLEVYRRGMERQVLGPYYMAAPATTADIPLANWPEVSSVPATWMTTATAQLTAAGQAALATTTAAKDQALAAQSGAVAAKDLTLAAKAEVEQILITDLATTDGQTSALINAPASATAQALTATIATVATPVAQAAAADYLGSQPGVEAAAEAAVADAVAAGLPTATTSTPGLMPVLDKIKVDSATASSTPDALMRRNSAGQTTVTIPTAAAHVARKDYVDNMVTASLAPGNLGVADLDTIVGTDAAMTASYYQSTDGNATPERHYPTTKGGHLTLRRVSANQVFQTYEARAEGANPGKSWRRSSVGGAWSVWVEVGGGTATLPAGMATPWAAGIAYAVGDVMTTARGDRLKCVTAHTSAAIFTDDLPKWVTLDLPQQEATMLQQARASKGGGIGVGNKAAIAYRFDDWHEDLNATVMPLLKARGFPAGHATIADLTAQPWADGDSAANVLDRFKNGMEVHSHGDGHTDPSAGGLPALVKEIVTSKATIESWGVKCQGWMQPGATPTGSAIPYGTGFTNLASLNSYAALLIRQTYPLSEMYASGIYRNIPHGAYHGLDHITISDGMTYAAVIAAIDVALREGRGLELMTHAGNIGKPGNMTLAEWTAVLDYVVTKWEAGECEVLTPSGLMFADRGTWRAQLVADPDFTRNLWTLTTGRTIETVGSDKVLQIAADHTGLSTMDAARPGDLVTRGFDGETWVFEGWARSTGASVTVSRVLLQSYPTTTALSLSLTRTIPAGATWTRVRHAFSIPPGVDKLTVALSRNSGDGIQWKNVRILKV